MLVVQKSLDVPAAAHDVVNECFIAFNAVHDHVLADREAAQAKPQILIAAATNLGLCR